jgi:hypothetical protein
MEVQRLPRRLFYRWTALGVEIEYPTNIPNPAPNITCDTVQVTVPPAFPAWFTVYATQPQWGSQGFIANSVVNARWSWQIPTIRYSAFFSSGHCQVWIRFFNANGTSYEVSSSTSAIYFCGSAWMTPSSQQLPRRDLLVGADRIINPTINAPCPTWRLAGGNCPPNSLDCGNCCLDCAAVNSAINGVTSAVLPYSAWRKR